ncbi:WD40-repeat-containing domain protein [Mycena leptocephala]|nr:WD40-repeat-containing domain protein [Mycena leptocephala]
MSTGIATLAAGPFEGHHDKVHSVSFSPDDRQIVSGSADKMVRVWVARTGSLAAGPFKGHRNSVNCVSFSPDGGRIVSGSADRTLRVWDVQTGVLLAGPFKHAKSINSVAFSPDGEQIVSASDDISVRVWNAPSGLVVAVLEGYTRPINSIAFSPDGKWIVAGSQDRTVRVWGVEDEIIVPRLVFEGHSASILFVAFSPDSRQVASGAADRTIRVFELDPDGAHRPFGDGSSLKDGWILSELIVWVPPWLRRGLYFPHTSLVISASGTTKLDFGRFTHGTSWEECVDQKGTLTLVRVEELVERSFDVLSFFDFIAESVIPQVNPYARDSECTVLILDNCRIHHNKEKDDDTMNEDYLVTEDDLHVDDEELYSDPSALLSIATDLIGAL